MHIRLKHIGLAALLTLAVLVPTLLLSVPAAAETAASPLMGELFFGSDGNTYRMTDGALTLPAGTNGHSVSYNTAVSPAAYDTPSNAVRFVLSNSTACTYLNVKYTYDTETGPRTETQHLEINAYSTRCTYLLRTEHADELVSMTLTIPEATGGAITLYAMETVCVYTDGAEEYGTILSCTYNAAAKTVTVKGSVYHDIMIRASGGTLALYRLTPEQTVEELLADPNATAVAQSAISIGFELQTSAADVAARFARYVVVIRMADGTCLPLAQARYATAVGAAEETDADRSDFKGIDTTLIASAVDSNVGSAIVDVDLNRLENEQHSGYLYTVENEYFYFDRTYLAELDAAIRSLSGAACKVYLRFLVKEDATAAALPCAVSDGEEESTSAAAEGARYRALRADDAESLRYLYAYTSFLCSRYSGSDKGSIAGIIVGTRADEASVYNYAGEMTLDRYASVYGQAFATVALAARDVTPSLTMVVPVSDGWNTPVIGSTYRTGSYTTELFIESLARYLSVHGAGEFSMMVESTHNPYGLSNTYFEPVNTDGLDTVDEEALPTLTAATTSSRYLSSENIELLDTYLNRYAVDYSGLSSRYLFHWTPDAATSGNALSAAYVYHYYRLFGDEHAAAFFVSFRGKEEAGNLAEFSKIKYLVKYIDTPSGSYRTSFALEVFGVDSWEHLLPGFDRDATEQMAMLEGTFTAPATDLTTGSYSLFDFSTANSTRGWYAGNHCSSLSVGSSEQYGKTLDAVMDSDLSTLAEYSDIAYRFERPLDLTAAPYLTLTLAVDCASDPDAVFEVKLVIGSDEGYMEAKQVVKNGELTTMTLNASYFANVSEAEYLRLSVKTVMGDDDSFTLHLGSLITESREYDSATLHEIISAAQRASTDGGLGAAQSKKADTKLIFSILLTALFVTTVAILMLGHYQKNNPEDGDGD